LQGGLSAAAGCEHHEEIAGLAGHRWFLRPRPDRLGLANATFQQKRQLIELLTDRVIVTDAEANFGMSSRPIRAADTSVFVIYVQTISATHTRSGATLGARWRRVRLTMSGAGVG
jgi:hypothetical protein